MARKRRSKKKSSDTAHDQVELKSGSTEDLSIDFAKTRSNDDEKEEDDYDEVDDELETPEKLDITFEQLYFNSPEENIDLAKKIYGDEFLSDLERMAENAKKENDKK
jgi:hypothetical protein